MDVPRRRRLPRSLVALLLAASVAGAACATSRKTPPPPALSLEEKQEVFHAAWSKIAERHFDPATHGVDWNQVRVDYAPRVEAAETHRDLGRVLNAMLGELKHSHLAILRPESGSRTRRPEKSEARSAPAKPGSAPTASGPKSGDVDSPASDSDASGPGVTGLAAEWADGTVLVTRVAHGSPAAHAGIRIGDEIVSIDGMPTSDLRDLEGELPIARWQGYVPYVVEKWLEGDAGRTVEIEVRSGDAAPRPLELVRTAPEFPPIEFGFLGEMSSDFEARRLHDGTLYVRFSPCFTQQLQQVEEAIRGGLDAPGLLLDLRGNPGGLGATAMGVARLLVKDHTSLGVMQMRPTSDQVNEIRFDVNPDDAPFTGPVVLLVNGSTGSTAEILAGGLQSIGRARVVGSRTMGAALPSTIEELPHGWRMLFTIGDFTLPDGRSVEGPGVEPDVEVEITRASLASGADPVLAAAIAEIGAAPTAEAVKAIERAEAAASTAERAPCIVDAETEAILDRMVEAAGGEERLRGIRSMRSRATMSLMGIQGKVEVIQATGGRSWTRADLGAIGETFQVTDGEKAWSLDPFQGGKDLTGEERAVAIRTARIDAAAAWREMHAKVEIVERLTEEDGREAIVLRYTPHEGDGQPATAHVDAKTFLPYRTQTRVHTSMGDLDTSSEILEYAEFAGIPFPKVTRSRVGGAEFTTTVESVELDVEVDPGLFVKPKRKKKSE